MTDPNDTPLAPFDETEYRRRQKARARLTGLLLGGLALLFFFITIAKIGIFAR